MLSKTKVLIGVPCSDTIKTKTAFSLFNLRGGTLTMQMGCDVAHNRNKLVTQALDGYTHLLFIDSDMTFNADTLERMLKHDKDILGLACNKRKLPLESVIKPLNEEDITKTVPTTLFEAKAVGTGVLLVKTEVFKNIEAPWFEFEYVNGERIGEDIRFCRLAREKGYKIFVDPTIPVGHLGDYQY